MKAFILVAVLMIVSMQAVAADSQPNCDEFSSRAEFVEYLEDNMGFYRYDTDDDGIACEGNWAVMKSEIPARTDVSFGCSSDVLCFTETYIVNDEIRIVAVLTETDDPEKMYIFQDEYLIGAGYVNITDTTSEENLDFTKVEDHRTYWNSTTGRVVIIVVDNGRLLVMEVRNVPDEETNSFIAGALENNELVEPDKYEYKSSE